MLRELHDMLRRSEVVKVHPLYRVDPETGTKALIAAPGKSFTRTRQPGADEISRWERATTYYPTHNGVASPVLAHLANAYPFSVKQKLITDGKTHLGFVTGDEKTAFQASKPVKFPKSKLGRSKIRGMTLKKIERQRSVLVAKPWTAGLPDISINEV